MAKKTRRFLALMIALALCAGQIAVPAMAVDTTENYQPSVEVTVTDVTVTETPNPAAGEITTTTTTQREWDGVNQDGATVTGSETDTDYIAVDDYNGTPLYEGGSIVGQETESLITTETETSTEEDVVISESAEDTSDSGSEDPDAEVTTGDLITGETDEGEWVEGDLNEGEYEENEEVADEGETSTDIEFDEPTGITLDLTPGKTTTITKEYTLEEILANNIEIPEFGSTTEELLDENDEPIGVMTTTYTAIEDEDGNVIGYEITSTVESYEEKVTVGEAEETLVNEYDVPSAVTIPEDVQEGTKPIYNENNEEIGTEEIVIEETYDNDGILIGYKIIKTTTTYTYETQTAESTADSTTENAAPIVSINLPEKPAGSETVDDTTGVKTLVTVKDILDADGKVIGYEIITTKTDASGIQLSTATEKRYGTVTTINETTVTDPTTVETLTNNEIVEVEITEVSAVDHVREYEIVTEKLNEFVNTSMTEKSYEFIEIDGKIYFVFTGEMNVTEGRGHGSTTGMVPITPDSNLFNKNSSKDLAAGGDLYEDDANRNQNIPEDGFKLVGNGISSALTIGTADGGGSSPTQFKLVNADGKTFYAMCVDLSTYTQAGYFYDIEDITDQSYYQTDEGSNVSESAEKIRIIALNGFWGTKSGLGSMTDVKAFLTDYLTNLDEDGKKGADLTATEIKKIVDSLTEGQALAATQAALWNYGAKDGSDQVNDNKLVVETVWNWYGYSYKAVEGADYDNTEYLYKALLAAANDPDTTLADDEGVEFLDAEDITGGSIAIKEKVSEGANGIDTYNTDISFTMSIEPSKLNGDLLLTVIVDGEEVESYRLTDSDKLLNFGRIEPNEDGSYTIPNVELKEGVYVTLNLSGTQALGSGVYIYTSEVKQNLSSQTLIGLATGERQVNLNMNMKFNVTEPTGEAAKVEGFESFGGSTTDTRVDVKTDYRTDLQTTTTSDSEYTRDENGSVVTYVYADVTVTKVTTTEKKTERSWMSSWLNVFDTTGELHDGDGGFDIPDEEVPLADAPKTGDISGLWAVISLVSLSGVAILGKKREEV